MGGDDSSGGSYTSSITFVRIPHLRSISMPSRSCALDLVVESLIRQLASHPCALQAAGAVERLEPNARVLLLLLFCKTAICIFASAFWLLVYLISR